MDFVVTELLFPATVLAIATSIAAALMLSKMWEEDE